VLDALKKWVADMPAYDPDFFRVDEPKEPKYSADDINSIVSFNQKMTYDLTTCWPAWWTAASTGIPPGLRPGSVLRAGQD
jgi:hypothetical protein